MDRSIKPSPSPLRIIVIVIACISLLMTIFDFLFIGNIFYVVKWTECGQPPVILQHPSTLQFNAQATTSVITARPGFFTYKHSVLPGFGTQMFCTLDEAKTAAAKVSTPSYIEIR